MLTVRGSNIAARARTKRRRTTKSLACTACRDSLGAWREAHERVRIMPKVNDLVSDGRHDLKNAIHKQGGPKRVAASLGRTTVLTVPERLRASLEYLRTELKPYLQLNPKDEGRHEGVTMSSSPMELREVAEVTRFTLKVTFDHSITSACEAAHDAARWSHPGGVRRRPPHRHPPTTRNRARRATSTAARSRALAFTVRCAAGSPTAGRRRIGRIELPVCPWGRS